MTKRGRLRSTVTQGCQAAHVATATPRVTVTANTTPFGVPTGTIAACSITTGTGVDLSHDFAWRANSAADESVLAGTRGYDISAGTTTYNLVCRVSTGSEPFDDSSITAIFTPGSAGSPIVGTRPLPSGSDRD